MMYNIDCNAIYELLDNSNISQLRIKLGLSESTLRTLKSRDKPIDTLTIKSAMKIQNYINKIGEENND